MARLKQILARPDLGYFGVGLYDCKNGYNVGGVIRATAGFDGRFVVVQGNRWQQKGNWKNMDTEGGYLRIPCYLGVPDLLAYKPEAAEIVGVELHDDATPLPEFEHPKVAMYVFGPEDGELPLDFAKKKVYIPSNYSLNLFSAVTAVCYDRIAKIAQLKPCNGCPNCGHVHWSKTGYQGCDEDFKRCNACGKEWTRVEWPE